MDEAKFKWAYTDGRNGASFFVRHWYAQDFFYSDGVQECAEAGCYWLLDIVATECLKPLRASCAGTGMVEVSVAGPKAQLSLTVDDDAPAIWERSIDWTDMPEGEWVFELVDEGDRFVMILITEH